MSSFYHSFTHNAKMLLIEFLLAQPQDDFCKEGLMLFKSSFYIANYLWEFYTMQLLVVDEENQVLLHRLLGILILIYF